MTLQAFIVSAILSFIFIAGLGHGQPLSEYFHWQVVLLFWGILSLVYANLHLLLSLTEWISSIDKIQIIKKAEETDLQPAASKDSAK